MEVYGDGQHPGVITGIGRRTGKENQMMYSPKVLAETYFQAWRDREFDTFADLLADDVHFMGPMAEVHGREAAVQGIRGLRELLQDIRVIRRFVDGDDVVTWFELVIDGIEPIPVANWSRIREGRIVEIRVTFDPRPLLR
jgi:hypothetical protein